MAASADESIEALTELSSAAVDEVRRIEDSAAVIENEIWGTSGAMADHLGSIYLWVAQILRSGTQEKRGGLPKPTDTERPDWFSAARDQLVDTIGSVDPARPCWTLTGDGTADFWSRRMVCETLMHLGDLRTAGGRPAHPVPEATVAVYADAVDEHFEVFLARSKSTLDPLPGSLALAATDSPTGWRITPEWEVGPGLHADTVVHATTGDLALLAWDRVRALDFPDRFVVDGDSAILDAYRAAAIHP